MDWNFLLASARGRINLKPLWLALLTIYGVATVAVLASFYCAVHFRTFNAHQFAAIVNCLVSVQFFLMCPLIIKRLHDRNRSGWWLVAVWILPQAHLFFGRGFVDTLNGSLPGIAAVSNFVVMVVVGWAVVELGFMRGTLGPNAYGADPLPLRFRSLAWNTALRSPFGGTSRNAPSSSLARPSWLRHLDHTHGALPPAFA